MIWIIGALETEITSLVNHLEFAELVNDKFIKFWKGEIKGQKVAITTCGVGKANAAATTGHIINNYKPNKLISIGSCGIIKDEINIGDIVISEKLFYGDVDVTIFGYNFGQVPRENKYFVSDDSLLKEAKTIKHNGFNVHFGNTITIDSFSIESDHDKFQEKFDDPLIVDMESTAITQVANKYKVPVITIRSGSDHVKKNTSDTSTYEENEKIVKAHLALFIVSMIEVKND